jgi:hypothetical protein
MAGWYDTTSILNLMQRGTEAANEVRQKRSQALNEGILKPAQHLFIDHPRMENEARQQDIVNQLAYADYNRKNAEFNKTHALNVWKADKDEYYRNQQEKRTADLHAPALNTAETKAAAERLNLDVLNGNPNVIGTPAANRYNAETAQTSAQTGLYNAQTGYYNRMPKSDSDSGGGNSPGLSHSGSSKPREYRDAFADLRDNKFFLKIDTLPRDVQTNIGLHIGHDKINPTSIFLDPDDVGSATVYGTSYYNDVPHSEVFYFKNNGEIWDMNAGKRIK